MQHFSPSPPHIQATLLCTLAYYLHGFLYFLHFLWTSSFQAQTSRDSNVGQIRRGKIRAEAFLVAPRRQFESLYSQQNPNLSRQLMHSSEAFLSEVSLNFASPRAGVHQYKDN